MQDLAFNERQKQAMDIIACAIVEVKATECA